MNAKTVHPASHKQEKPVCWIITEGIAGTENQCLGVANALNITPIIKRISLNEPWNTLSPWLGFEQRWSFSPALEPPWPDLLLAAGRKSIAASRYIKKKSGGKTITVQIQDPRVNPVQFDLVAVPAHDPTRGPNVIVTCAAPNKITPAHLEQAKKDFPDFGKLKAPRIAVLIGGNSKAYQMTETVTQDLACKLSNINAGLMITCSRRTGEKNKNILETKLNTKSNFFWNGENKNPYMAMLGWADIILVTADSVSMLSESCTTGKPVYMIELKGGNKRISKFHRNLIAHGALRIFNDELETWTYAPLNDAEMVANEIKKRFSLFNDTKKQSDT